MRSAMRARAEVRMRRRMPRPYGRSAPRGRPGGAELLHRWCRQSVLLRARSRATRRVANCLVGQRPVQRIRAAARQLGHHRRGLARMGARLHQPPQAVEPGGRAGAAAGGALGGPSTSTTSPFGGAHPRSAPPARPRCRGRPPRAPSSARGRPPPRAHRVDLGEESQRRRQPARRLEGHQRPARLREHRAGARPSCAAGSRGSATRPRAARMRPTR